MIFSKNIFAELHKAFIFSINFCEYDYIQERAKPVLNHVGDLTRVCREDVCKRKGNGPRIMALALTIRSEREAFAIKTETERVSVFLPVLGLMAGCAAVLIVGLEWYFLTFILSVAIWSMGFNISCFPTDIYVLFFVFLQFLPSAFLIARFACMAINRNCRLRRIKKHSQELEILLSRNTEQNNADGE